MTVLSLAAELALLALDDRGSLGGNVAVETALAGAWLVELLEHGRIEIAVEVAEPVDDRTGQLAADIGLAPDRSGLRESVQRRLARRRVPSSTLDDEWIAVLDARPTGMPDVDLALTWLASPDRRSLIDWIAVLGQYNTSGRVLTTLESAGVVGRAAGQHRNPFAPAGWKVVDLKPERDLRTDSHGR